MKRKLLMFILCFLCLTITGCQSNGILATKTQSSKTSDVAFRAGTQALEVMQLYIDEKMTAKSALAQLQALEESVPQTTLDQGNFNDGFVSIYILGLVTAINENELHRMGENFALIKSIPDAVSDLKGRLFE